MRTLRNHCPFTEKGASVISVDLPDLLIWGALFAFQLLIVNLLVDKKKGKKAVENKPDLLEDDFEEKPPNVKNETEARSASPSAPMPYSPLPQPVYSVSSLPSEKGRDFPVLQPPNFVVVNLKMPPMDVKNMAEQKPKPKVEAPKTADAKITGSKKQFQATDMVKNLKAAIKSGIQDNSKIIKKLELKLGDEQIILTERKLTGEKASRFDLRGLPAQMRLNADKNAIEFTRADEVIGWIKIDSIIREIVFTIPPKAEEIKPRDCGFVK